MCSTFHINEYYFSCSIFSLLKDGVLWTIIKEKKSEQANRTCCLWVKMYREEWMPTHLIFSYVCCWLFCCLSTKPGLLNSWTLQLWSLLRNILGNKLIPKFIRNVTRSPKCRCLWWQKQLSVIYLKKYTDSLPPMDNDRNEDAKEEKNSLYFHGFTFF